MSSLIAMGCVVAFVAWKECDRDSLSRLISGLCLFGAFALLALRFKGAV